VESDENFGYWFSENRTEPTSKFKSRKLCFRGSVLIRIKQHTVQKTEPKNETAVNLVKPNRKPQFFAKPNRKPNRSHFLLTAHYEKQCLASKSLLVYDKLLAFESNTVYGKYNLQVVVTYCF